MKLTIAIVLLILFTGCAGASSSPSWPSHNSEVTTLTTWTERTSSPADLPPFDDEAQLKPDAMRLDPEVATAGEAVQVMFTQETMRGVHYVLEEEVGGRWVLRFHLISDWGGLRQPEIFDPGDPNFGVPDVGQGGIGPDLLLLPERLTQGKYRICTANSLPNICARVTVESRD